MCRTLVCTLVVLVVEYSPAAGVDTWEEIIPGVQHLHRVTSTPWQIHVIKADLTNPRVRVCVMIKNDNDYPDAGEPTSLMARRHRAVAAINTDFFCGGGCANVWHCPQGYTVTDGLYQLPPGFGSPINPSRTTFQISKLQDQVLVDTVPYAQGWWHNVTGGGPRLVRNGVVSVEWEPDVPDQTSRQPRTGCAISADGRYLILATVDGRQWGWSVGMTGAEMAALLIEMGGYQGMGFDSGGSTTMVINGYVANQPSDGSERYVAAALGIIDAFAQGPNPSCWFDTDFENPPYPPGTICGMDDWVCESGQPTVHTASPSFATQALVLSDDAAYRDVTSSPVTDIQWADCNVRASTRPVDGTVEVGSAPGSGAAAIIAFRPSGKIAYFEGNRSGGGTWKEPTAYFGNRWYRVSVRLDYYKLSYSFYLDGHLRASGVAFRDSGAASGLRSIRFADSTGAGGEFHVDDVYAGNVEPWFPRVSPDSARVIIPGPRQFHLVNGPAVGWEVVDEKDPGGVPVPPGTVATIDGSGLLTALSPGTCRVRGTEAVGKADDSGTIEIVGGEQVWSVRAKPIGSAVDLAELVVTGVFDGYFYAQTLDRSAGIVVMSGVPVEANQKVAVTGQVSSMDGELAVAAGWVEITGSAPQPLPLFVLCRDVARQDPGGAAALEGCSVAALLVEAAGTVQSVEAGRFFLDDGSGIPVPVIHPGLSASDVGESVVVTGLVAASAGSPAIRPRSPDDVVLLL